MKKTYWMSFVNDENRHLGCCIIDAIDPIQAIEQTVILKINPGGQVALFEMPDNEESKAEIVKWGKGKFISTEDLRNDGYRSLKDLDGTIQEYLLNFKEVSMICEKHNNSFKLTEIRNGTTDAKS